MGVKLTGTTQSAEIIRPMVYIAESDLISYSIESEFPIIPCNLCGSQDGLKRQEIKKLLLSLESQNPRVRGNLLSALGHIDHTHLLVGARTALPDDEQVNSEPKLSTLVQLS